ncbi:hypothetical protein CMO93_04065 [Candidatus Woesearchaeota archaeon]|nr:hypothetical protein [Candidatus Woesearchaeota archaeon]|tara:strand:- start:654 stop:1364 length:711 start_codon:yes stop_codon:yes gene_type:complete
MSLILTAMIVVTAFLALYWVFYGQRKHNEMMNPKRKTELKAILFDLDGVIIDSFEAWFSVFNQLRKKYNLKEISKEEFRKKVWGGSVERDAKEFFNNLDPKVLKKEYEKLMGKNAKKTKLNGDAEKVLKAIKHKKFKIGLVTNSPGSIVNKILNFHKIDKYFDVVITADDVEKAKPYPDPILKACEKLKVMPDEIMYVGDTKIDYKAGKSAGAFVVGLNTHGDLVISRLRDLLQLL